MALRHAARAFILAAIAAAPLAVAQAQTLAPGETKATVVNGRINHTPKRFDTPQFKAQLEADRQAKALARQQPHTAREHGVKVSDGRMTFAPKAARGALAAADQ